MPLLLALLALLGFGGPERPGPGPSRQEPDPVPAPAPLALRVDLPDLAPAGMDVPFRLALANRGDRPIPVELGGRPVAFDLVVRRADGAIVWRRLEGVPIEMILVQRTLGPGEVVTFEGHWDQRDSRGKQVPPGVYQVRGVLPVPVEPGGWGSDPRELTVTP